MIARGFYGPGGILPPPLIKRALADADTALLRDTFTGENGTLLSAHTMDVGPGWSMPVGELDIQSNRATTKTLTGGNAIAVADAGSADGVITCRVIPGGTAATSGVAFRATDNNNRWFARWVHGTTSQVQLWRTQSGTATLVDSASKTPGTAGEAYDITVTLDGTSITAEVDGTTVSATDAFNQAVTTHGIRSVAAGAAFDDFVMEPL